jgi:hypothetical protein
MSTKRSAKDVLDDIEHSEMDDEIDRVLALTEDELHRELTGAGFDVDELHAKADALYEKLQQGAPPGEAPPTQTAPAAPASPAPAPSAPAPARLDEARARRARLIAGLALAASVVGVYTFLHSRDDDVTMSPKVYAEEQRRAAADACDHARWRECLKELDQADAVDPAGAGAARTKELRDRATKALSAAGEQH